MARTEFQVTINAPVELVYRVSQDYAVRYDWDPFPEKIAFLQGADCVQKGVRVAVTAKSGLQMEVEFVQVDAPTVAAIKMITGPVVLESFSGSWIFKPVSPTETRARFVYAIRTKWWSLPVVSERLACWYFSRAIAARLNGLKSYCETLA
jgi:hypothetical protein